jgi:hypothetical protein
MVPPPSVSVSDQERKKERKKEKKSQISRTRTGGGTARAGPFTFTFVVKGVSGPKRRTARIPGGLSREPCSGGEEPFEHPGALLQAYAVKRVPEGLGQDVTVRFHAVNILDLVDGVILNFGAFFDKARVLLRENVRDIDGELVNELDFPAEVSHSERKEKKTEGETEEQKKIRRRWRCCALDCLFFF